MTTGLSFSIWPGAPGHRSSCQAARWLTVTRTLERVRLGGHSGPRPTDAAGASRVTRLAATDRAARRRRRPSPRPVTYQLEVTSHVGPSTKPGRRRPGEPQGCAPTRSPRLQVGRGGAATQSTEFRSAAAFPATPWAAGGSGDRNLTRRLHTIYRPAPVGRRSRLGLFEPRPQERPSPVTVLRLGVRAARFGPAVPLAGPAGAGIRAVVFCSRCCTTVCRSI